MTAMQTLKPNAIELMLVRVDLYNAGSLMLKESVCALYHICNKHLVYHNEPTSSYGAKQARVPDSY